MVSKNTHHYLRIKTSHHHCPKVSSRNIYHHGYLINNYNQQQVFYFESDASGRLARRFFRPRTFLEIAERLDLCNRLYESQVGGRSF
jgi:hypothetical protein